MKRFSLLFVVLMLIASGGLVQTQPTEATGTTWRTEFYNNEYLIAPAAFIGSAGALDFNWGLNSPASGVAVDRFSARFTSDIYFNAGNYRFTVLADDGIHLYVDSYLRLDTFTTGAAGTTLTADLTLSAGTHRIQLDYHEITGDAYVRLTWALITSTGTPTTPTTGSPAVIISTTSLRVRSGPSLSDAVLTRVYYGQTYALVGRTADSRWWQINVNGTIGWVSASYVNAFNVTNVPITSGTTAPVPASPTTTLLAAGTLQTTASFLNLRTGPGTNFPVITAVPRGTVGQIIGRDAAGVWWKINVNGLVGWIGARYTIVGSGTDMNTIPVLTS